MRKLSVAVALALVIAACGGDDDAVTDEAMTEETMVEEAMTDEAMSDESMTDEEMSDESMADEEMSDETMSDETMSEDEMSEGHLPSVFTVTITNTSETATLATPLAPGAFAVHSAMDTLFAESEKDRGNGLEALAEDGDPNELVSSLQGETTVTDAGVFANPDGGSEAGPALPGSTYSFTFEAVPGDYLSFATMFVQSNDWFFATASSGINLFDGDAPLSGDITSLVGLWDAGTEVDETPGEGPNQAPRQESPNDGETESEPVSAVAGYEDAITVTITVDQ